MIWKCAESVQNSYKIFLYLGIYCYKSQVEDLKVFRIFTLMSTSLQNCLLYEFTYEFQQKLFIDFVIILMKLANFLTLLTSCLTSPKVFLIFLNFLYIAIFFFKIIIVELDSNGWMKLWNLLWNNSQKRRVDILLTT